MFSQQLVQKMVNDRAPNVKAVKESGSELLKGKDPKERKKIEGELKELDTRWDALTKKVRCNFFFFSFFFFGLFFLFSFLAIFHKYRST
jgi:hypothetical protein